MDRHSLYFSTLLILFVLFHGTLTAQTLKRAYPDEVGISSASIERAGELIDEAIQDHSIPGAVLAVVRHGKLAALEAYGSRSLTPKVEPMTTQTIFDLASLSKVFGTTMAVYKLLDHGDILLSDPVSKYLEGWESRPEVTIRHLLTHTSGLAAYPPVSTVLDSVSLYGSPQKALAHYIACSNPVGAPGEKYVYSCMNFVTLQNIIEKVSGMRLDAFLRDHIYQPMGLQHTGYLPPKEWKSLLAPTEVQKSTRKPLRGEVHDPLARELELGVSGNAGLFSDAEGLAALCAMILSEGSYMEKEILSPAAVNEIFDTPDYFPGFARTQGWAAYSNYGDGSRSPSLYHTGYTGTMAMIDRERDYAVILLTNRVHPADTTSTGRLNAQVLQVISAGIRRDVERQEWADPYFTRLAEFDDEAPITSEDIVMLGNSITYGGGDWNARFSGKHPRIVNRGIIGDSTDGILYRLERVTSGKPSKIFLLIGANDLTHNLSPKEITSRIEMILDRIRIDSPETRVYLQTIMPIDESTGVYSRLNGKNRLIPVINATLRKMAPLKGVTLVDLHPHFLAADGKTLDKKYHSDGLHLNPEGYKIWAEVLKPYIKE